MDNEPGKHELTRIANDLVLKNIPIPSLPNNDNIPFIIRSLEDILIKLKSKRQLLLPKLSHDNETITVLSDYGGESPDSRYLTYSFLFVANYPLQYWSEAAKKLRAKHKLDNPYKEIAFKDLNYGPISRILDEWLNMANYLPGLLFTYVISKNLISCTGSQSRQARKELSRLIREKEFGVWKPNVAEKLIRILHIICYWISILSTNGQKLFWMTDDDSIIANSDKSDSLGELLVNVLSIYTNNKYEAVGYAKPFEGEDRKSHLNDLLSIPDLAAGSMASLFTKRCNGKDSLLKDKTNKILGWLSYQGVGLKKLAMIAEVANNNQYSAGLIELEVIDENRDIQYIPVWM